MFANQEGREEQVIKTMCVDKAMVGWHTEKLGRICRERCGGATYLEINMVSQVIGGAHSGLTAEGDNKVLM